MNFDILDIVLHLSGYQISVGLGSHLHPVTDFPHNPEQLGKLSLFFNSPLSVFSTLVKYCQLNAWQGNMYYMIHIINTM